MQLSLLSTSDDALLNAVIDDLTIHPEADLASVLARVDQQRAAQHTGVKREQRHAQQQHERGVALQRQWTDLLSAAASDTHAVSAVVAETADFLRALVRAAETSSSARNTWRRLNAEPTQTHTADLVVQTLQPLLSFLTSTSATARTTVEEAPSNASLLRALRAAYVTLLKPALQAMTVSHEAAPIFEGLAHNWDADTSVASLYAAHTRDTRIRQLFSPYLAVSVEPLEKELRYHFSAGRVTARVHEPQHFFLFLADCLDRQAEAHRRAWVGLAAHGAPPPSPSSTTAALPLRRLGQVCLVAEAVVVFQSCYGWQPPPSPMWCSSDFVVVTVNAVLDFLARVEGQLCEEAAELLVDNVLVDDVLQRYAAAAVKMASAALQTGAARLWRRSFLLPRARSDAPQVQPPLYASSLHMVRALEALLRRMLNTLLVLKPAYAAVLWRRTVEPVLAHFLEVAEAQAVAVLEAVEDDGGQRSGGGGGTQTELSSTQSPSPSANAQTAGQLSAVPWSTVLSLQWCVASVQVVTAAAEDWLGMLRESATTTTTTAAASMRGAAAPQVKKELFFLSSSSDALDGLALFRDRLARRAAAMATLLTRKVCSHATAEAAVASRLAAGLEAFLRQLEDLPDEMSRSVLRNVIEGVLREALPQEQQAGLNTFAEKSGLVFVVRLLTV